MKLDPGAAAITALSGVYGNIGFMGIPVLTTAIGDWVAVPLALIVLVDVAVLVPLATTVIDTTRPQAGRGALKSALFASLIKNPIVLATLVGLAVAFAGIAMPAPMTVFTDLLGRSAGPVAMFALGAVLAGRPLSEGVGVGLYGSVVKLGLYPLGVWAAMTLFGIGADWRLAATLGAAMPMAAVLFVIAQQYDVMPQRMSTAVLISTVVSMATVTALVSALVAS